MYRTILKSKIHRARVTDTNLNYEGSLSIDPKQMDEAYILPFEKVDVVYINNGQRFSTYAIRGEENSGEIALNGGVARLGEIEDLGIIITYTPQPDVEIIHHHPIVILVDENNNIKSNQK
jgi:aspartate 1-decarboxylase